MSSIIPAIKCPLWHLFLWSRSQSRITHFLCCYVYCLFYSRMGSQPLWLYESHILECRLVVECPSVGFLSLFLKVIFQSSPGHCLMCDLAGCLLCPLCGSCMSREAPAVSSAEGCLSGPFRTQRKCPSGLWPLTPNPGGAHQRPGIAFEWNFIHSLRVTQA